MKTNLIPKSARILPTKESRQFHRFRNDIYTVEKFQSYNDWFYFIHVDPFIRWVHAIGMVIGLILYFIAGYKFWILGFNLEVAVIFFCGIFFFYFLPLISHFIYDGGTAKSSPDKFHSTLIPVIHINILTLSGRYDLWLRSFIAKYPFTVEAWELEERHVREK